jgi:hypothetical protein
MSFTLWHIVIFSDAKGCLQGTNAGIVPAGTDEKNAGNIRLPASFYIFSYLVMLKIQQLLLIGCFYTSEVLIFIV